MIDPRRIAPFALMILGLASPARSQDSIPPRPQVGQEPRPIELTVSARGAEVPAFRHRLFPVESERNPGDAAPIYLRLHGEFTDGMRQLTNGKATEWLALPIEKLPVAEARAYVNRFAGKVEQIRFGSRRRSCDWNYTLAEERERSYQILLPDAQEMRQWGRLLALKARVEVAEGNLDESARTIEMGLAFARHVGEGTFLVNGLIGISLATTMLQQVDELIARPDAPNLYWPLTALPRPLLDLRPAFETETRMIDWAFPELGAVDRPRDAAEWTSLLRSLHARMAAAWRGSELIVEENSKPVRFEVDYDRFRASLLPEAREYLQARGMRAVSDDQAAMTFVALLHREIRDELSRPFYLPFSDGAPVRAEVARRRAEYREGPLGLFVAGTPSFEASHGAEVRLGRKVAALRVIEAIRMQAAKDGGKVPDSLAAVTIVPVPGDPMTGRPFDYRREGDSAVLGSVMPGDDRLTYRLTIRR